MSILVIILTLFFMTAGIFTLIYENIPLLILIAIATLCVIIYELGRIIEILQKKKRAASPVSHPNRRANTVSCVII